MNLEIHTSRRDDYTFLIDFASAFSCRSANSAAVMPGLDGRLLMRSLLRTNEELARGLLLSTLSEDRVCLSKGVSLSRSMGSVSPLIREGVIGAELRPTKDKEERREVDERDEKETMEVGGDCGGSGIRVGSICSIMVPLGRGGAETES